MRYLITYVVIDEDFGDRNESTELIDSSEFEEWFEEIKTRGRVIVSLCVPIVTE